MSTKSDFRLSKWYLDCVADNGDTFIGYVASLRWKALSLHYTSELTYDTVGGTHAETSLHENPFPHQKESGIHWSSSSPSIEGDWDALTPPIQRQLYNAPAGAIEWVCVQPGGKASIRLGKDRCIEGMGYVERVELSIPPWQLPITELRWGRFISDSDALVWIDWHGEVTQTLLFHNGIQVPQCKITDEAVVIDHDKTVLSLTERVVLRSGPLVSTALSMIPGITKIFSSKIVQANECKWRSRGRLTVGDAQTKLGWAIHEVVKFA